MTKTLATAASMFLACTGPAGEDGLDGMDGEHGASLVQLEADTTWDTDQTLGVVVHVPEGVTLTIAGGVQVALFPTGSSWSTARCCCRAATATWSSSPPPARPARVTFVDATLEVVGRAAGFTVADATFSDTCAIRHPARRRTTCPR